jgi:hypothetical protein
MTPYLVRSASPRHQEEMRARALDAWRVASDIVRARWDLYSSAERAGRGAAFAAYVAALEHEAAAADELERLSRPLLAEAA